MSPLRPTVRLAVLVAALAAPLAAQQRLFALDSANRIWRVDGHTTTSGTLVQVATVSPPFGYSPRDLAFDPSTQRFFVLAGGATGAVLLEVDPVATTTTQVCALSGVLFDGLDRRSDGVLVTESGLTELVLVDPATCSSWRLATTGSMGQHTSSASLAFDVRGFVTTMAPDGTALTIDPLDGQASAPPLAQLFSAHGLEAAADGDLYVATLPWTLVRRDAGTGQLWQVALTNQPAGASVLGLALELPADGVGVAPVCAGAPNSTGRASTLEVVGLPIVGSEPLEVRCRDLPPSSLGYFLMGPNSGALPVASGVLCIASPVLRNSLDVLDAGASGTVRRAFQSSQLPVGVALQVGDTYVFQFWHRDLGGTANFSAARSVTFR